MTATLVTTFEAPGHYASTCSCTGPTASSPFPIRTDSPARYGSGGGAAPGRAFPSRPAAPRTPAASGSTTWSRRSRTSGRTGRRRDSPPTSSTSPVDSRLVREPGSAVAMNIDGRAARSLPVDVTHHADEGPDGGEPARRHGRAGGACWRVDADGTSFRDLNGNGELDPYEDVSRSKTGRRPPRT